LKRPWSKLEDWMCLELNREKTRVMNLREEGARLDFLGYTFRFDRDLCGRDHKYLNVFPSDKALSRERGKLREMTSFRMCFKPIPALIEEINEHLRGWSNYFSYGYPTKVFHKVNWYVRERLKGHLSRRSQRPFRPPEGTTHYACFEHMGLIRL
jgi:RNA-directed DNA polymerase